MIDEAGILDELIALRHALHRHPELAGGEAMTAQRIATFFASLAPDNALTDLGGHGLAFVFDGAAPGPTGLLRCELDALPIGEAGDPPHRSTHPGVGHL